MPSGPSACRVGVVQARKEAARRGRAAPHRPRGPPSPARAITTPHSHEPTTGKQVRPIRNRPAMPGLSAFKRPGRIGMSRLEIQLVGVAVVGIEFRVAAPVDGDVELRRGVVGELSREGVDEVVAVDALVVVAL